MKLTDKQIQNGLDIAFSKASGNAYFGNGFRMGVQFALEQINKKSNKITDVSELETGEYYKVNGKKRLYWNGEKWQYPCKIKGFVRPMADEDQPIFKYATKIEE